MNKEKISLDSIEEVNMILPKNLTNDIETKSENIDQEFKYNLNITKYGTTNIKLKEFLD